MVLIHKRLIEPVEVSNLNRLADVNYDLQSHDAYSTGRDLQPQTGRLNEIVIYNHIQPIFSIVV